MAVNGRTTTTRAARPRLAVLFVALAALVLPLTFLTAPPASAQQTVLLLIQPPAGGDLSEGDGTVEVTVSVAGGGSCPVNATQTVDWSKGTSDSAISPSDIKIHDGNGNVVTSGTLTFAPCETEKVIEVEIVDDFEYEDDETFTITLSNASHATILQPDTVTVKILDNGPVPSLEVGDKTVGEGRGQVTLTVTIEPSGHGCIAAYPLDVDWSAGGGTATDGDDYQSSSGTLRFGACQASKTITVNILDDSEFEQDPETFIVTLSNPSPPTHVTVGEPATVTITDNEPPHPDDPMPMFFIKQGGEHLHGSPATGPFEITVDFGTGVTGFTQDDLMFTDPDSADDITRWTAHAGGVRYTAEVTPTKTAGYTFWVEVGAGETGRGYPSAASIKRFVKVFIDSGPIGDTLGPGTTIKVPSGEPEGPFFVHVVFTERVYGFAQSDLRVKGSKDRAQITSWFADPNGRRYTAAIASSGRNELISFNIAEGTAQDGAGNPASSAETKIVKMAASLAAPDTMPPEVADIIFLPSLGTVESSLGTFEATFVWTEPVTGFTRSGVRVVGPASTGQWTARPGGRRYTLAMTRTGPGSIYVSAGDRGERDAAGNLSVTSLTEVRYDSVLTDTRPSTVISAADSVRRTHDAFDVTVTFSEPVTGLTSNELAISGTAAASVSTSWQGGASEYTATITPDRNGAFLFNVADGVAARTSHSGLIPPTNLASNTLRVLINPEDVTLDGAIDILDEFRVGTRFGEQISGEPSDGNPDVDRDGVVTLADFNLIVGRTRAGGTGTASQSAAALRTELRELRQTPNPAAGYQQVLDTLEAHLAQADSGLTATAENVPQSHNGAAFTFRLAFSEVPDLSFRVLRDESFAVSGGRVTRARRVDGRSDRWQITVEPDGTGEVTLILPATADCEAEGAVCTAAGKKLSTALSITVSGPGEAATTPLTATLTDVPGEHDGAQGFTFRVAFSEAITSAQRDVREFAFNVTGGTVTKAKRIDRRSDLWKIWVAPSGHEDVSVTLPGGRQCAAAGAVCTADGRRLSNSPSATVIGPPALAVADAEAREGTDDTIAFEVTLSRAAAHTVTVDYATADGTASAGEDYTATSGTLTFAAGETAKTVAVPVLDDAKDEGEETFTLTVSSPSGAVIADGSATGTIENGDPMPKAWLARFGRTVASQVVDAVSARLEGGGGSHVTVGGQRLGQSGAHAPGQEAALEALMGLDDAMRDPWDGGEPTAQSMTGRELLLGSSFHLASQGEAGGPSFSAWGRVTRGSFDADMDDVRMDGDVTTGMLGADVEGERWLAGVALSRSEGEGSFTLTSRMASNRDEGEVESRLTGVYPYARLSLSERVSAWALAGYGTGELTLTESGGEPIETDLSMTMGAVGGRGTLVAAPEGGGFALALKSDAFWVRMESDKTEGMEGAEADASRLRLLLDASRPFETGGGTLTPSVELGLRHDGGDAETGTGVEVGAGLRYAESGVTVEGSVRGLVAHEASGYEEWGAGSRSPWRPLTATHRAGRSGCGRSPTPGASRRTGSSRPGTVSTRRSATVSAHRAVSEW